MKPVQPTPRRHENALSFSLWARAGCLPRHSSERRREGISVFHQARRFMGWGGEEACCFIISVFPLACLFGKEAF
jgi:hypothetical protein